MDTNLISGEDFKLLVKSTTLNEAEIGKLLGCTRENVFKIYKKKKVKISYYNIVKQFISDQNSKEPYTGKINQESTLHNNINSVKIADPIKEIEGLKRTQQALLDHIDMLSNVKDFFFKYGIDLTNYAGKNITVQVTERKRRDDKKSS